MGLDPERRSTIVYRVGRKDIKRMGMLVVFENPDIYGKLLNDRRFNAYDIQDSREYKFYSRMPLIVKDAQISDFKKIVRHHACVA